MKFTCQAADLMSALRAAQSVTDARPVRPIYECVLLDARKDGVTVTGGNSEQQISVKVEASVSEKGNVAVPLKVLIGYVSALSEEVNIVSDKHGGIVIKSGTLKAVVAGQDVDEYTVLGIDSDPIFTADASSFANAISSVSFAIGSDASAVKRVLLSAHVEVDVGGRGTIVTMSDRKMGRYYFPANMISDSPIEMNIPSSVIKPICSVLQGQDSFSVSTEGYVVCIKSGDRTFIFPQVAGKYVEWQRVLSNVKQDKFAKADISALSDAIRFSGVSGKNGETYLALLHFSGEEQSLVISSRGVISDSKAEISVDYTGEDIDIAFDVRVLQEVVNFCASTGASDIEIGMSQPSFTATVRPVCDSDNCLAVIAPVRTQPTNSYAQNA